MVLRMNKFGAVLGTRQLGEIVRLEIASALNTGSSIVFDLDGVTTVSNSFADECFAKLLLTIDFGELRASTSFINASPFVQSTIKVAFQERLRNMAMA